MRNLNADCLKTLLWSAWIFFYTRILFNSTQSSILILMFCFCQNHLIFLNLNWELHNDGLHWYGLIFYLVFLNEITSHHWNATLCYWRSWWCSYCIFASGPPRITCLHSRPNQVIDWKNSRQSVLILPCFHSYMSWSKTINPYNQFDLILIYLSYMFWIQPTITDKLGLIIWWISIDILIFHAYVSMVMKEHPPLNSDTNWCNDFFPCRIKSKFDKSIH